MPSVREILSQIEDLDEEAREPVVRLLLAHPEMAEEVLQNLPQLIRVEKGRYDLESFARTYLPHMVEQKTPEWHFELDRMIERMYTEGKQGVVVAAPRGFGKSARLGQFRALHSALYKRSRFVLVISNTDDQAQLLLQPIKQELETNQLLRQDFGDLQGDKYEPSQIWNSQTLTLTWPRRDGKGKKNTRSVVRPYAGEMTMIAARGAGGALRGMRFGAYRPSLVILDDSEDKEDISSPLQREKMWNWFTTEVLPMLDPECGKVIVIGTILHADSTLARLLQDDTHYLTKVHRAIREDGTSLWPERFSVERLMELKETMGPAKFAQEYMNAPFAGDAQVFKPEWFRSYGPGEVLYRDGAWRFRERPMRVFQAIDPAIADTVRADYFAAVTIGITEDRDIVVMDAFAKRGMDFPSQVEFVKDYYEKFLPERVGIEDIHYQRALRQEVLRRAEIPIKPVKSGPKTSKIERIMAIDVHFANGKVFLRRAGDLEPGHLDPAGVLDWRIHDRHYLLYEQLVQFPSSAHDDLADALEMAISLSGIKMRSLPDTIRI